MIPAGIPLELDADELDADELDADELDEDVVVLEEEVELEPTSPDDVELEDHVSSGGVVVPSSRQPAKLIVMVEMIAQ
jgi:hypothetical protein